MSEELLSDFSETVSDVAIGLVDRDPVTAAAIALGIQTEHPEYAGSRFALVVIDPEAGPRDSIANWLTRVRDLYDLAEVNASRHHAIDGELMLVGLALLDGSLRNLLARNRFLETLWDQIDANPAAALPFSSSMSLDPGSSEGNAGIPPNAYLLIDGILPISSMALTPSGEELAAAGGKRCVRVRLRGVHTESPARPIDLRGKPGGIAYLDDRLLLAVGEDGSSSASTYEGTGDIEWITGAPPNVCRLIASGVGSAIAGTSDGSVWFLRNLEAVWEHVAKVPGPVQAVAFNGRDVVATGDERGQLRLWELSREGSSPPLILRFESRAHAGPIEDLQFTVDGRLATAGDGIIRVWDPRGESMLEVSDLPEPARVVAFDPSGARIAIGGVQGGVALFRADTGERLADLTRHLGAVSALAWAPDGRCLYTAAYDGTVLAHDVGWAPNLSAHPPDLRPGLESTAHVAWMHDEPAKRDALQREGIALGVATQVRRMVVEEPGKSFLVHVDGPWGSGKTTLLGFLQKRLQASSEEGGSWVVATFDAWRQSKVGPPWLALTSCLRSALARDRKAIARVGLRIREWARLAGAGQWVASALFIVIAGALAYFTWHNGWANATVAQTVISVVTGVAALVTLVWSLLKGTTGLLIKSSARRARDFEESQRNPMDDIVRHFGWLLERAGKPVALFVDDLDRCSNGYVVELLDTLQTLVRPAPEMAADQRRDSPDRAAPAKPSLVFVVAADGRWIRQSYEEAHKIFLGTVSEPGRPLGYLFLEKLFQVTVDVPSLSPSLQETFFADLLTAPDAPAREAEVRGDQELSAEIARGSTEQTIVATWGKAPPAQRMRLAGEAIAAMTREPVQRKREHALQRFAPLLEPNARSMKRFLIAYNIARMIRTVEGSAIGVEPLAQWMVVRSRWPSLADYLARHPDAIGSAGRSAEELIAKGIPEDVATMLADRDGLLKAVIDFVPGDPLDARKLRECCGMADASDEENAG